MNELGVVAVMLAAELVDVASNTLFKAAMKKGMNEFVFVMYSHAFATCLLFLLALIFYRKRTLPPLTYSIVGLLFLMGVLGCCTQFLKFFGIGYSSPTLASALSDLVPAFTFLFAVLLRTEKLDWKANSTWAKSVGTLVSITGALIITLYKGQPVINNHLSLKLFPQNLVSSAQFDWVFGALLLVAFSCFLAIDYILVARIIRYYPAELVVVLMRISLTSILSIPAALISEKDPKSLRLGFNMELIAIVSSAILVLSFRGVIHTWALGKEGPVYVAMFKPLEIVFAVILGITFLGDSLYIGSGIGIVTVVMGFYAVMWGKAKEKVEKDSTVYSCESLPTEVPLLYNKGMGE